MVQRSINSAVDSHELAGDQRSLLDLIDRLQFAQLDNVKLPQIVVVGDQSAGKSSVLEAISGTPFPRDAGACTRFATEIRLRRAAEASLSISIIPDRSRNFADQEKLRAFGGRVDATMAFETLMRYAVDLIAPKGIPGRFAAKDILVVEKRGPDMPLLTLVDLPGLVRNANNDQSIEDIRTIEALSDRYMKSRRTIILAVVGGNTDYVQAPILTKARQFDPKGTRTIGVLTKPDLTKDIGLEDKFIELVRNQDKENHFALGWFVLLNPGPRQNGEAWPTQEEQRQREADFFSRGKWAILPPHMCGAAALKQKLSVQLQRHIGRYVKVLRRQIQDALDKTEAELKGLGEGKDTPEEMRVELVELFSSSKELVIPAVYGFYKNPPKKNFFRVVADPNGTPAQNLRARAIEENDRFAERVRANGRKMTFHGASGGRRDSLVQGTFESKQDFARREVESLLRQIRGTEFPMDPKPRAVYMLFQSYSENWPQLAQEHKENLAIVCNEFLSEVIDYVWPERMRYPIMMHFLDLQMQQLLNKAQVELERLTQDMNLEVQPYDPEYEEKLRRWHGEMTAEGGTYTEPQEVLEKMLIYYELSAKSFIRNVITQVVERHLLQGIYGIFDSVEILKMSNETIEAIAAENRETRDRRMTLKQQKTAIEEARSICASLAMRKELRSSIDEDLEETSDEEDGTSGPRQQQQQQQQQRRSQPQDPRQPLTHNPSLSSMHQQQQSAPHQQQQTTRQAAPPQRSPRQQRTADTSQYNAYASAASPVAETPSRSSGETANDYYATSSQAPTSVPPPPPRPEKVSYEASAPAAAAQPRASQPYAHSYGGEGLGFDAQQAEYAAAQKKRGARGLFNRG